MRITLSQAIEILEKGGVVAVPTETVYGLAASIKHPSAMEKIYTIKGRPRTNPLIVHVADLQEIKSFASHYPPNFETLAKAFWPGPLTCILLVQNHLDTLVRAALPTAAFRIPDSAETKSLLKAVGPLVMPSANISGSPSATRPEHVEADFGESFPVLDGGKCQKGVESTILHYQENEWVIVRLGALAPEAFEQVLGYQPRILKKKQNEQPLCPGQLFRHYAPKAELILGDPAFEGSSHILGFKERSYPVHKRIILLGSLLSPVEVAENLYHALRQLDQEGAKQASVDMDFPRHGLWKTIEERLTRAANL